MRVRHLPAENLWNEIKERTLREYTVASLPCWIPIITILFGPFAADFLLQNTPSSHTNLTFLSRYLHLRDNRNFLKKFRHRYFYNHTSLSACDKACIVDCISYEQLFVRVSNKCFKAFVQFLNFHLYRFIILRVKRYFF